MVSGRGHRFTAPDGYAKPVQNITYNETGVPQTNAAGRRLILCSVKNGLFLLAVAVTAHELVHATGGIDKLLLTGEEGV